MPFSWGRGSRAKAALVNPVLATKSGMAAFNATRILEYPVKLETEVIGYVSGVFSTETWGGIMKSNPRSTRTTNFRISSDGKVLEGFIDDAQRKLYLPVLDIQQLVKVNKDDFTNKTGLPLKGDTELTELLNELTLRVNGKFGVRDEALYVTTPTSTNTMSQGKTNAIDESKKIQTVILTAVQAAATDAQTAATAAAPPAQVDPNATALASKYGARIDDYDSMIRALSDVHTLAETQGAPGEQLAVEEIHAIVGIIETRRTNTVTAMQNAGYLKELVDTYGNSIIDSYDRVIAALDAVNTLTIGKSHGKQIAVDEITEIVRIIEARRVAAANAAAPAQVNSDVVALAELYNTNDPINTTDKAIIILNALNKSAKKLFTDSILQIIANVDKKVPILETSDKIIAFLKSVPITKTICDDNTKFDDKTVALLFMVYTDRLDVHFIKKRSTIPFKKTTVIGDTHYISSDSKDILTIEYAKEYAKVAGVVDKSAMLEILKLVCLPVSFKIADTTNNNSPPIISYGFRHRHTLDATRPHEVNDGKNVVYPFTGDNGEIELITDRAIAKQAAVVASAQFTNVPTIAKLTDLKWLLCGRDPEILTSGQGSSCEAIQKNIEKLQAGQTGGRRSRKRMNKNKRASSRHRYSRRHRHGHNSRKRYSAGSKSKSGLKSKSASKRRRNQTGGT